MPHDSLINDVFYYLKKGVSHKSQVKLTDYFLQLRAQSCQTFFILKTIQIYVQW